MFPNLIYHAIPFFVGFIFLEILISAYLKKDIYETRDALSSIAMGLGNVIIGIVSKALVFAAFTLVHRLAIFDLQYQWWVWVLAFFADDLSYYCFHRSQP